ncbi:MAG: hypothetical protein PHW53_01160 [Patescibacteria group bacterium]|nr:hypothetical protein [Patescibacteria group bacterium]
MRKFIFAGILFAMTLAMTGAIALPGDAATLVSGDLIKGQSFSSVYYYAENGKRYVFPNEKTYFTWYTDFSEVKIITDAELAAIQIGGNVTYKPGYKMIKITTADKVYAVEGGGVIRWVKTEEAAETLYGLNWNDWIDDVPDGFFTNYREGQSIEFASDYSKTQQSTLYYTINHDKGFVY